MKWLGRLWRRLIWLIVPPVGETAALYVIGLTSLMFVAWSVLLIWLPAAVLATPVSPLASLFGSRALVIAVLLAAALLAQSAIVLHRFPQRRLIPAWLLILALSPQQLLLLISAFGGIRAAVDGHYADGTVRPWQFIVADQLPVILLALIYTAAMLAAGRVQEGHEP